MVRDSLEAHDGEPLLSSVCMLVRQGGMNVIRAFQRFWSEEEGQDVAEYAVMLAVILVIVVGTVRLIGSNANNVFSQVGSQLNQ